MVIERMDRNNRMGLVLVVIWLCFVFCWACSDSSSQNGGIGATGGSGAAGGAGAGGIPGSGGCPPGYECAAPAGTFVCTVPSSGLPPICVSQEQCGFGQCQLHGERSYCTQPCGVEPVQSCPQGSICTAPSGTHVCVQESSGFPPACATGADCPYGECLSYLGARYCTLPCVSPAVEQCPADTACVGIGASFVCALLATGQPPPCATEAECAYGECLQYEGQGYCTLPCTVAAVDACPAGAECNSVGGYWMCTPPSAAFEPAPVTCDAQQACATGDCVFFQGQSYCLQYCTQPVIAIYGSVFELGVDAGTGEAAWLPVSGVQVCVHGDPSEPCATTGPEGTFALKGLSNREWFAVTLDKAGYQPVLRLAYPFQTLSPCFLYTTAQAEAFATAVGATYPDASTGHLLFGAGVAVEQGAEQMAAGFTVSLEPAGGLGPFYANESQQLDPALTAASSAGWGAFFNLAPGDYRASFSNASGPCGEPIPTAVASGYLTTHVAAVCP